MKDLITLENKKIYVGSYSKDIQKKAFELGWYWNKGESQVQKLNAPFIFFHKDMQMSWAEDMEYFNKNPFKEISLDEFFKIKKEYQFEPFEKVLVRDDFKFIKKTWKSDFFSHIEKDNDKFPFVTISEKYSSCIPYKGNEHLLGTSTDI